MTRRTALNRAAEEIALEVIGNDIAIDFDARTITSSLFGTTRVPKLSTKRECKKYIKRHIKGTAWQSKQEEQNGQKSFSIK